MKPYTASELKEFDTLTELQSSPNQMERITGRLRLRTFVAEHGREKCDLMFEELMKRDQKIR